MKYLFLLLMLVGCTKYPIHHQAIIHDYIFENARRECENNGGLHYIVADETIFSEKSRRPLDFNDYPCSDVYHVRCQDGTLHTINSGTIWCFIATEQMNETLGK